MAITQTTPQAQIDAYMKQQIERRIKAIINAFNYVGISCINEGRNNGTYQDRTGNLRNSIGYVVVHDGIVVHGSNFGTSQEVWEGAAAAEQQLRELVAKFPHGIALIVVAGMNYASAVEAKNLNVLSSAELLADKLVPEIMKKLGFTS